MDYRKEYERWLIHTEGDIKTELEAMDEASLEDAFYRDLAFGTGGLRGTIGAGTNRMNIYVVAKASQGLANYLGAGASVVTIQQDILSEQKNQGYRVSHAFPEEPFLSHDH